MVAVFLEPRVSPLLVAGYEAKKKELLEILEDEEDIREGVKALAAEAGTVTWEEYQHRRTEQRQ